MSNRKKTELAGLAAQVRDATLKNANTPARVGGVLTDLVDSLYAAAKKIRYFATDGTPTDSTLETDGSGFTKLSLLDFASDLGSAGLVAIGKLRFAKAVGYIITAKRLDGSDASLFHWDSDNLVVGDTGVSVVATQAADAYSVGVGGTEKLGISNTGATFSVPVVTPSVNGQRFLPALQGADLVAGNETLLFQLGDRFMPAGTTTGACDKTLSDTLATDGAVIEVGVENQAHDVVFKDSTGATLVTVPGAGTVRIKAKFRFDGVTTNHFKLLEYKPMGVVPV